MGEKKKHIAKNPPKISGHSCERLVMFFCCWFLAPDSWSSVTHSTAICDDIAAIPHIARYASAATIDLRYPAMGPLYLCNKGPFEGA